MLSYAGVQLRSDSAALAVAEARLSLADLKDWAYKTWPGKAAACGWDWIASFERPVYNRLTWPVGASRFAFAYVIASDVMLNGVGGIRSQAAHSLPLVMDDGNTGRKITASMFMLPPRPLGFCNTGGDQWLLTLVDSRFFWWDVAYDFAPSFADPSSPPSWAVLIGQYGTALGVSISMDAVPAAYLNPPPMFGASYDFIPPLLDAACEAVGLKLVVRLDGTVRAESANTANGVYAGNVTLSNPLAAGGQFLTTDLTYPLTVTVVDPTDREQSVAGTIPLGRVTPGTHLLRTPILAPDLTTFQALAVQAAADWYAWQGARPDAAYNGVCPWTPGGFEDRIEWTHHSGAITTRVQRPPWNVRQELTLPYGTRAAFVLGDVPALVGGLPGVGTAQLLFINGVALVGSGNVVTVFNLLTHAVPGGSEVGLILEPYSDRWLIISDGCGLTVTDGTTTLQNVGTLEFPNTAISDGGEGNCGRIAIVPTFATIHTCDITLIDPPPVGTFILTVCSSGSGGSGGTVTNIYNYYLYLGDNFYLTLSCCGMIGGSGHSGGGGGGGGGGHILACCPGLVLGSSLNAYVLGCTCADLSSYPTFPDIPLTWTASIGGSGHAGWVSPTFACGVGPFYIFIRADLTPPCVMQINCEDLDIQLNKVGGSCDVVLNLLFSVDNAPSDLDDCCGLGTTSIHLTEAP